MEIVSVNTNVTYAAGTVVERPAGLPGYLYLHYITPGQMLTREGLLSVRPGACILYPPGMGHKTVAHPWELRADGVYFRGPDAASLVDGLQLPLGLVFYPADTTYIAPLLSEIRSEMVRRNRYWERIAALDLAKLLTRLLRDTERSCEENALRALRNRQRDQLQEVRARVHQQPGRKWTVADMAGLAHMSPPRFCALYKQFFGVSPFEDLTRARIDAACWLLTNTKATMEEVAERSGFSGACYFSQVFKRRVGCPPSRYYLTHVAAASCRGSERDPHTPGRRIY